MFNKRCTYTPNQPPVITILGDNPLVIPQTTNLGNTPPEITVLGDNPVNLPVQSSAVLGYQIGDISNIDPTAINQPLIDRLTLHAGTTFLTQADMVTAITTNPSQLFADGWPVFFVQTSLDQPYNGAFFKTVEWFYDDDGTNRPLDSFEFNQIVSAITPYVDAGATANDFEDGDLTANILTAGIGVVDVTTVGQYTISYDVTDSGGLTDHKERIVNINSATPVSLNADVVSDITLGGITVDGNSNATFNSIISGTERDGDQPPFETITLYPTGTQIFTISSSSNVLGIEAWQESTQSWQFLSTLVPAGYTINLLWIGATPGQYSVDDSFVKLRVSGAPQLNQTVEITSTP